MADTPEEPLLLTPGPITTSRATKERMLHDWGSRDRDFIALTRHVQGRLLHLARGEENHVCVPIQGSGTFGLEAMLGTLVPQKDKVLILVNGAYGARIAEIAKRMNRNHHVISLAETCPLDPVILDEALAVDPTITHVAAVHCETGSGLLNPIDKVAAVTAKHGRRLLLDVISTFGALPLDVASLPCDAVTISANKCLEGVPGITFAIVREESLAASQGNATSLSLDLFEQWRMFEETGQWRFTPPTQVLAALAHALEEHDIEGGIKGRGERYRNNCQILIKGMQELGFQTFLPFKFQAPIIVAFHSPSDPNFTFPAFYDFLRDKGYAIYPGKVTTADTFRIGCIGKAYEKDILGVLAAVRDAMKKFGFTPG